MKKIALMLALLLVSASAYAMTDGTYAQDSGTGIALGALTVKASKSVYLGYKPDNATNGSAQGYLLGAYHGSGTQSYASSSGDTKIYKSTATATALPNTAPTGSQTAQWGTSWTAQ